ncbi:MAG: CBS domain-containing protein [Caldithrix sp.]|nr:CBS domain-containing protein [Caldithrix sp.]
MQTKKSSFKTPSFIKNINQRILQTVDNFKMTEHTFVLIGAVIIGLLGGYGAVFIQLAIKFFHKVFWQGDISLQTLIAAPWYWKLAVPTLGGLAVGLIIQFYSKEAKGHGVPEVMEAIALRNGIIRARVVLAKLFSSALYIAAGGSVGREGPVIQIGSAVGSTLGQFFKVNPKRMRIFVACGAASGIAAAFNAPVAGALFAVEIILGDFAVAQFSPIVLSSVAATVVSRHYHGDFPAFVVPAYQLVSPFELVNYLILGFLAGLVALLFIKVLYASEDYFDNMKLPQFAKGALGGIGIGLIGLYFPHIFGVGYDTMDMALSGQFVWHLALALVFVKIIATSISLGSGGSGGIFAPSLFLGGMLGVAFGNMVHYLFPDWTAASGAYALVAMGGVVGAATRGPITAILIIFEMTSDYKIILPLMITTIIATLLANRLHKESIYTLKLVRRGINLFGGRELNVLRSLSVSSVIKQSIELVHENTPFPDILKKLSNTTHNHVYVVDDQHKLTGVISMQEIRQTIMDYDTLKYLLIARDVAKPHVITVRDSDNLDKVMKAFGRTGLEELPVIASNGDQEIIGTIWQSDVIDVYNHQIFLRDMSGEMGQSLRSLTREKTVHVVDQYHLNEEEAPAACIGQSIKEIDLRNRFNLEILLINRQFREANQYKRKYIQPKPDLVINMNDTLLVFGKEKDIKRFQRL